MIACVSAVDAVVAVGIYQLLIVLIGLDEFLGIVCRIAVVNIVVRQSVTNHQLAMQLCGTTDGIVVIAVGVLLRCPHVTLRINAVVIAPRGRRCNGDATVEHAPTLAHRHQRVETAEAPAPNGNALFINIGLLTVGISE